MIYNIDYSKEYFDKQKIYKEYIKNIGIQKDDKFTKYVEEKIDIWLKYLDKLNYI